MQVSLPGQIQGHLAARIANRGVSAYRRAFTSISRTPSRRSGSICRSHWRRRDSALPRVEPASFAGREPSQVGGRLDRAFFDPRLPRIGLLLRMVGSCSWGASCPPFSGEPSQSAPGGTLTLEACRYTALRPRKLERTLDVVVTGDSAGS
jgi:hypothetical protein